jgi:hypothetical protein
MEWIGSDAALQQLPPSLRQQLALERFNLHKPDVYLNTSRDPAFDPQFLPQNCGVVELPCYWIERRHLYVFGAQEHAGDELGFLAGTGPHDSVLFPIHPTSVPQYAELLSTLRARDAAKEGLRIWAVPTASVRTFLAWPDHAPEQALFVKTSLHSPIVGDRRLHKWRVARSVGLSRLVQDSLAALPAALSYFPETLGLVPRQMPDSGVIVRSIPLEIKTNRVLVAPLFSLMGGRSAQPLFLALIEQGRVQPLQFLEEVLCARFARLWLDMTLRFGLILEAHGQDLMLALSLERQPLDRFYYRDFEGLQVDWELRHALGLSTPANMPNARTWHETYATWGYRYGELVWYKLRISLLQYLHFVLHELELMMREWQAGGRMRGPRIEEADLTAMFSRQMMKALDELYGVRAQAEYNIHRSLSRFVRLVMSLRKDLLGAYSPRLP